MDIYLQTKSTLAEKPLGPKTALKQNKLVLRIRRDELKALLNMMEGEILDLDVAAFGWVEQDDHSNPG